MEYGGAMKQFGEEMMGCGDVGGRRRSGVWILMGRIVEFRRTLFFRISGCGGERAGSGVRAAQVITGHDGLIGMAV